MAKMRFFSDETIEDDLEYSEEKGRCVNLHSNADFGLATMLGCSLEEIDKINQMGCNISKILMDIELFGGTFSFSGIVHEVLNNMLEDMTSLIKKIMEDYNDTIKFCRSCISKLPKKKENEKKELLNEIDYMEEWIDVASKLNLYNDIKLIYDGINSIVAVNNLDDYKFVFDMDDCEKEIAFKFVDSKDVSDDKEKATV